MYRKMVFIFFSIMSSIPNDQKTTILLLFSGFSLYATLKSRPFALRELNILELQSNLTAMITIFAGALYILDVGDFVKIIVFFLIVVINSIFAVKWFLAVWDIVFITYERNIFRICPCFVVNFYILKKTIADTRASLNLPKFLVHFFQNLYHNKKNFTIVKI